MLYTCVAHIEYEVELYAESREEAEQLAFERLADDVTEGVIRMDLVECSEGTVLSNPQLVSVDVTEVE